MSGVRVPSSPRLLPVDGWRRALRDAVAGVVECREEVVMPTVKPLPMDDEQSDEDTLAPTAGDALRAEFKALRMLVDPSNEPDSTEMIREMREGRGAWPRSLSTPTSR